MAVAVRLIVLFLQILSVSPVALTPLNGRPASSEQVLLSPVASNFTIQYINQCTDERRSNIIREAFLELYPLALEVSEQLSPGKYVNAFISPEFRPQVWLNKYKDLYLRISQNIPGAAITTTCDRSAGCTGAAYAHTDPGTNTIIFCGNLFGPVPACSDIATACSAPGTPQRTLSSTLCRSIGLLHEITHLPGYNAIAPSHYTRDYARGVPDCVALAQREDSNAVMNADNYAFLAASIYFGGGGRCSIEYPFT